MAIVFSTHPLIKPTPCSVLSSPSSPSAYSGRFRSYLERWINMKQPLGNPDDLPSQETLDAIDGIGVEDEEGKQRPFEGLIRHGKTLVVFIRCARRDLWLYDVLDG